MEDSDATPGRLPTGAAYGPAVPLWRLVPTRGGDGRCLADFMMLIPELRSRPAAGREQVAATVREVCASYGDQVAFADINYSINVLWVSVAAEPGMAGRVAQSIRSRVPEALLIGGQLGVTALPSVRPTGGASPWWPWRRLVRRARLLLAGPSR